MTDDSYRGKARATFLAAIMVLSMVAMSATLVAPAAAQTSENATYDLQDQSVAYQGQDVFAYGDDITEGSYQVRSEQSTDSSGDGTFVESSDYEFGVDDDDVIGSADDAESELTEGALGELAGNDGSPITESGDEEDKIDGTEYYFDGSGGAAVVVIDTEDLDSGRYFLS
ncbi:MAG: surface glycoprotein, partial [Salinarchaeum sp.]